MQIEEQNIFYNIMFMRDDSEVMTFTFAFLNTFYRMLF